MFIPIYEILKDPLSLPIAWYWEYLILLVIDKIVYRIAFKLVGNFYNLGMSGKSIGSLFHCVIRLFLFVIVWAVAYAIIYFTK